MLCDLSLSELQQLFLLQKNTKLKYFLPMSGMAREVRGMASAIMSRKTVNASSTEMPSEIFSPASGGRQNPMRIKMSTAGIGSSRTAIDLGDTSATNVPALASKRPGLESPWPCQ